MAAGQQRAKKSEAGRASWRLNSILRRVLQLVGRLKSFAEPHRVFSVPFTWQSRLCTPWQRLLQHDHIRSTVSI